MHRSHCILEAFYNSAFLFIKKQEERKSGWLASFQVLNYLKTNPSLFGILMLRGYNASVELIVLHWSVKKGNVYKNAIEK